MGKFLSRYTDYDIGELPADLMGFFSSFTFQMMVLGFMYYGGMVILLYYTSKLPREFMTTVWLLSMGVNAGLIVSFPGLFYLDKMDEVSSMLIIISLGPLTLPRALVCYLSFRWNVKKKSLNKHNTWVHQSHHVTYLDILRKPVSSWGIDDQWINAIKRNVDIGVPSFWDKCRRKWRLVIRIAKWKII